MRHALVLAGLLLGCADPRTTPRDASAPDDDAPVDAAVDAMVIVDAPRGPDAAADTTRPSVLNVRPASSSAWLHDRFELVFSEPLAPSTVDASALRLVDAEGHDLTASARLSLDRRTVTVRAREDAAALGALRLEVAATVTDAAGNPLESFAPHTWQLAPWATATGLVVGNDPQPPAVATANERIVLATSVATGTSRRVIVIDGDGRALGGPLGRGTSITPALAGNDDGLLLAAWADTSTGTIEAALWTGAAWTALPSPGAGTHPAVAASPRGAFALGWIDGAGRVATARLAQHQWTPITTLPTASAQSLALALPDDTTLAVAVLDRTPELDRVRTVLVAGGLTERPPLALGNRHVEPARVAIAARGPALAVSWDEYSGASWSVHAALAAGSGWTELPMLDIDPPADARMPNIGLDGDGRPVVAWVEHARGYAARWTGMAWQAIAGDAWSGTELRPTGAALAMWRGRVPVVASTIAGLAGLALARFNGPALPRLGLGARAPLTGCAVDPATPPATLSATGCFTIFAGLAIPHAGLVPYDVRSELWTDGALKRRWLAAPDGEGFVELANGSLDAAPGNFIIKEFAIGDPAAPRVMETRFLVRTPTGWDGVSYRWRLDGSDADASRDEGVVAWPLPGGGAHAHAYPSASQCQRCHNASVGQLLGVRGSQLARRFDYAGIVDDQPRTLGQLGLLAPFMAAPLPLPHDPRASLEHRVRGYLAANCSHCHNPSGERAAQDFRIEATLAETGLCALLVPGDPFASRIYQRLTSRPGMPPIGTLQTDPLIVDLVGRWIGVMTTCP